ncbi:MAG: sulfatase-like hydrolase/transferase, partial [Anaerolineae bacterium]|nr:sulfatase-like hydrolase/transferase [Anaerolineae bacterium]
MTPPNILLILCDELRADALGFMGNPIIQTPNIDRLAQAGTAFTQCIITQPTCTPSRASILTGCYPSVLHSRMVGCVTPDDPRFLPHILADAGFRTASIGKLHLVPQRNEPEAIQKALDTAGNYYGFQEVDLVNGHGDQCFGPSYTAWLDQNVPDWKSLVQQRKAYPRGVNTYTWELPPEAHSSNYIGDRAVEFLRDTGEQPFFLHVSFPDPHYPFTVPEPYASRYDPQAMPTPLPPVTESQNLPSLHEQVYYRRNANTLRADGRPSDHVIGTPPHDYSQYSTPDWQQVKAIYYGMISLIDDQIGRILDTLDDQGLTDSTVIIFASDHGDYLGDHGFYGKGLAYDSVLRVPCIWRGPGITSGRLVD